MIRARSLAMGQASAPQAAMAHDGPGQRVLSDQTRFEAALRRGKGKPAGQWPVLMRADGTAREGSLEPLERDLPA